MLLCLLAHVSLSLVCKNAAAHLVLLFCSHCTSPAWSHPMTCLPICLPPNSVLGPLQPCQVSLTCAFGRGPHFRSFSSLTSCMSLVSPELWDFWRRLTQRTGWCGTWPGQQGKSEVRGGSWGAPHTSGGIASAPSAEPINDPTSRGPNVQINRRQKARGPYST